MKKLLCTALLLICLSVDGMVDGTIVPYDQSNTVNHRHVMGPMLTIDEKNVLVSVQDYIKKGNTIIPVGDWYTKKFPLEEKLLGYMKDPKDGSFSPIFELYAVHNIEYADRKKKMVVTDKYVNTDIKFLPQERTRSEGGYLITETFIKVGDRIKVIAKTKAKKCYDIVKYVSVDNPNRHTNVQSRSFRIVGCFDFIYFLKKEHHLWSRYGRTLAWQILFAELDKIWRAYISDNISNPKDREWYFSNFLKFKAPMLKHAVCEQIKNGSNMQAILKITAALNFLQRSIW
jgi:hypothetical protein